MQNENIFAAFGLILLAWMLICLLGPSIARLTARVLLKHANGAQAFYAHFWSAIKAYKNVAGSRVEYSDPEPERKSRAWSGSLEPLEEDLSNFIG